MSAFTGKKKEKGETIKASRQRKTGGKRAQKQAAATTPPPKKIMQYSAFYVNEIAGWHTNVSVNGCKAFLSLQGNPLGWHGLIQ